MDIKNRKGETGAVIPSRRARIFRKEDGYFYYRTREKMIMGPFDTEDKALESINDFIENFIGKTDESVVEKISSSYGDNEQWSKSTSS